MGYLAEQLQLNVIEITLSKSQQSIKIHTHMDKYAILHSHDLATFGFNNAVPLCKGINNMRK